MADSTITLRVVGDTAKAGNAPAAPTQAPGNAPATAPQRPSGPADSPAPTQGAPSTAQGTPANGGKSLAGKIGSFALGWGAQQLVGSLSGALATLPGRQREANWLGNVGGGALGGAAAGAAAGSVIPGIGTAVGAGIGAAIGAATGALTAWTESLKASRDSIEGITQIGRANTVATGTRRQDEAFARTLQTMTYDERLDAIADRARQIRDGSGDASIKNLEAWLRRAAEDGDTDTEDYRTRSALLSTQTQRLSALDALYDQTEATPPLSLLHPGEVTDALAKRGGAVGPTVDVADVNRDLLATLRDFFQAWKTRAANRPDTVRGIEAASGFATTAILK